MPTGPDAPTSLAPFATCKTENGATELRLRAIFGKWFKRSLWIGAFSAVAIFITLIELITIHQAAGSLPVWWVITGELLAGLALFVTFIFGLGCLILSSVSGEVYFDGVKLRLKDQANTYEIPVDHILGVRRIIYTSPRLEIDVSGPLKRLFFRGRRTALEISVPEGRIEFFRMWEEPKVAWLTTTIYRLLFPHAVEAAPTLLGGPTDTDVVVASRIYAKIPRHALSGAIIFGILATSCSAWYAIRGIASSKWPMAQGRVVHALFEKDSGSRDSVSYKAEIKYIYTVSGITYTNDDFGFSRSPGDDVVQKLIVDHPEGSPVTVHYDPVHPNKSVAIPGLGPMHWLIIGLSLTPFLLVFPMRRCTTPVQHELVSRYKITSARANAVKFPPPRVRWTPSEDAWRDTVRSARRLVLLMSVRILSAAVVAMCAFDHWLVPMAAPGVPWMRVYAVISSIPFLLIIAAGIDWMRPAPKPPEYGLSSEGILIPSKEMPLIRWEKIVSFVVHEGKRQPSHRLLSLHLLSGIHRELTLPGGAADVAIIGELSSRMPQSTPPAYASPLKLTDWLFGFVFVSTMIWGLGTWLGHSMHFIRANTMPLLVLSGLLAGPGTWIAIFLRNRRAAPQLITFACTLNMVNTFGSLIVMAIVHSTRTF